MNYVRARKRMHSLHVSSSQVDDKRIYHCPSNLIRIIVFVRGRKVSSIDYKTRTVCSYECTLGIPSNSYQFELLVKT